MSWVGIVFALAVKVAVVYIASNLPSTNEREGLLNNTESVGILHVSVMVSVLQITRTRVD